MIDPVVAQIDPAGNTAASAHCMIPGGHDSQQHCRKAPVSHRTALPNPEMEIMFLAAAKIRNIFQPVRYMFPSVSCKDPVRAFQDRILIFPVFPAQHQPFGMIQRTALKRVGEGSEIATVALFLATTDSSFIDGQLLRVDGGVDV